jgi:hypothetical protein
MKSENHEGNFRKALGLDTVYSYTSRTIDSTSLKYRCTFISNLTIPTNRNKKGYFLPTGAEWQYAYLGGASTKPYWGSNPYAEYAWCGEYSFSGSTHPVKKLKPNSFGLYDMAGNVEEWTEDGKNWGGSYLTFSTSEDLKGISGYTTVAKSQCSKTLGFRVARLAPPDIAPSINLLLND